MGKQLEKLFNSLRPGDPYTHTSKLGQHWFRLLIVAHMATNHHLNQCWRYLDKLQNDLRRIKTKFPSTKIQLNFWGFILCMSHLLQHCNTVTLVPVKQPCMFSFHVIDDPQPQPPPTTIPKLEIKPCTCNRHPKSCPHRWGVLYEWSVDCIVTESHYTYIIYIIHIQFLVSLHMWHCGAKTI